MMRCSLLVLLVLASGVGASGVGAAAKPSCTSALNGCQLNGACVAGACVCDKGWQGADCGTLNLDPTAHVAYVGKH